MKCRAAMTGKTFSVDVLMRNLSLTLVRDFQRNFNDPCFADSHMAAFRQGDIARIRELSLAEIEEDDVARFKAMYQIQSLSKRYRYQNDIYSDDELREKAITSFLETQTRLAELDLGTLSASDNVILDLAAGYIADVLGVYDDEEHRLLCKFGSGASVGIPARLANLAARWELPLSGSHDQISWFDSEMSQVACVQDYWRKQKGSADKATYHEVESLALTLVPKTFKSLRAIMPNTTIGSYMSYGLGEMMRKRLQRADYDIRTLQTRHKYYAQQGSIHGLYVTADLSSASDSITVALVERLFPRDWVEILTQSRIGAVRLPDGTIVQSKTFCTMGIGYTFPLETLVFLSLLKAIERFYFPRDSRRLISVYGDDMVYSSRMHGYVVDVFSRLGFVLNVEKTFATGHFRESCGGDYYRGVDVRPFQPRNGSANVGKKTYEAILYKAINGLRLRWSEYEIGTTLGYLTSEVERITGTCKIVPRDYPDDSGIKVSLPLREEFLTQAKIAVPKHLGHGVYRFSYLRLVPDLREETRHEPYLWSALGGPAANHQNSDDYKPRPPETRPGRTQKRIAEVVGILESEPLLQWRELSPVKTVRSKISGRRLRRLQSCVVISHTGSYKRRSGFSCFENRS